MAGRSSKAVRVTYEKGEKVLCYEQDPNKPKLLHEAKILEVSELKDKRNRKSYRYRVHFIRRSNASDCTVTIGSLLKDTEENRVLQNVLCVSASIDQDEANEAEAEAQREAAAAAAAGTGSTATTAKTASKASGKFAARAAKAKGGERIAATANSEALEEEDADGVDGDAEAEEEPPPPAAKNPRKRAPPTGAKKPKAKGKPRAKPVKKNPPKRKGGKDGSDSSSTSDEELIIPHRIKIVTKNPETLGRSTTYIGSINSFTRAMEIYDDTGNSSDDLIEYPEHRINMRVSETLRQYMDFNYRMVCEYDRLLVLPSKISIVTILEMFIKHTALKMVLETTMQTENMRRPQQRCTKQRADRKELEYEKVKNTVSILKEVADGIRIYFDFTVTRYLLYEQERAFVEDFLASDFVRNYTYVAAPKQKLEFKDVDNFLGLEYSELQMVAATEAFYEEKNTRNSKGRSFRDDCDNAIENFITNLFLPAHPNPTPALPKSADDEQPKTIQCPQAIGFFIPRELRDYVTEILSWQMLPTQTPAQPSMMFGATHLTRLLLKLPHFLNATNITDDKLRVLLPHLDSFVGYLEVHKEWYNENNYVRSKYNIVEECAKRQREFIEIRDRYVAFRDTAHQLQLEETIKLKELLEKLFTIDCRMPLMNPPLMRPARRQYEDTEPETETELLTLDSDDTDDDMDDMDMDTDLDDLDEDLDDLSSEVEVFEQVDVDVSSEDEHGMRMHGKRDHSKKLANMLSSESRAEKVVSSSTNQKTVIAMETKDQEENTSGIGTNEEASEMDSEDQSHVESKAPRKVNINISFEEMEEKSTLCTEASIEDEDERKQEEKENENEKEHVEEMKEDENIEEIKEKDNIEEMKEDENMEEIKENFEEENLQVMDLDSMEIEPVKQVVEDKAPEKVEQKKEEDPLSAEPQIEKLVEVLTPNVLELFKASDEEEKDTTEKVEVAEQAKQAEHVEQAEQADKEEQEEQAELPELPEQAKLAELAEQAELPELPEQAKLAEQAEQTEQADLAEQTEQADLGEVSEENEAAEVLVFQDLNTETSDKHLGSQEPDISLNENELQENESKSDSESESETTHILETEPEPEFVEKDSESLALEPQTVETLFTSPENEETKPLLEEEEKPEDLGAHLSLEELLPKLSETEEAVEGEVQVPEEENLVAKDLDLLEESLSFAEPKDFATSLDNEIEKILAEVQFENTIESEKVPEKSAEVVEHTENLFEEKKTIESLEHSEDLSEKNNSVDGQQKTNEIKNLDDITEEIVKSVESILKEELSLLKATAQPEVSQVEKTSEQNPEPSQSFDSVAKKQEKTKAGQKSSDEPKAKKTKGSEKPSTEQLIRSVLSPDLMDDDASEENDGRVFSISAQLEKYLGKNSESSRRWRSKGERKSFVTVENSLTKKVPVKEIELPVVQEPQVAEKLEEQILPVVEIPQVADKLEEHMLPVVEIPQVADKLEEHMPPVVEMPEIADKLEEQIPEILSKASFQVEANDMDTEDFDQTEDIVKFLESQESNQQVAALSFMPSVSLPEKENQMEPVSNNMVMEAANIEEAVKERSDHINVLESLLPVQKLSAEEEALGLDMSPVQQVMMPTLEPDLFLLPQQLLERLAPQDMMVSSLDDDILIPEPTLPLIADRSLPLISFPGLPLQSQPTSHHNQHFLSSMVPKVPSSLPKHDSTKPMGTLDDQVPQLVLEISKCVMESLEKPKLTSHLENVTEEAAKNEKEEDSSQKPSKSKKNKKLIVQVNKNETNVEENPSEQKTSSEKPPEKTNSLQKVVKSKGAPEALTEEELCDIRQSLKDFAEFQKNPGAMIQEKRRTKPARTASEEPKKSEPPPVVEEPPKTNDSLDNKTLLNFGLRLLDEVPDIYPKSLVNEEPQNTLIIPSLIVDEANNIHHPEIFVASEKAASEEPAKSLSEEPKISEPPPVLEEPANSNNSLDNKTLLNFGLPLLDEVPDIYQKSLANEEPQNNLIIPSLIIEEVNNLNQSEIFVTSEEKKNQSAKIASEEPEISEPPPVVEETPNSNDSHDNKTLLNFDLSLIDEVPDIYSKSLVNEEAQNTLLTPSSIVEEANDIHQPVIVVASEEKKTKSGETASEEPEISEPPPVVEELPKSNDSHDNKNLLNFDLPLLDEVPDIYPKSLANEESQNPLIIPSLIVEEANNIRQSEIFVASEELSKVEKKSSKEPKPQKNEIPELQFLENDPIPLETLENPLGAQDYNIFEKSPAVAEEELQIFEYALIAEDSEKSELPLETREMAIFENPLVTEESQMYDEKSPRADDDELDQDPEHELQKSDDMSALLEQELQNLRHSPEPKVFEIFEKSFEDEELEMSHKPDEELLLNERSCLDKVSEKSDLPEEVVQIEKPLPLPMASPPSISVSGPALAAAPSSSTPQKPQESYQLRKHTKRRRECFLHTIYPSGSDTDSGVPKPKSIKLLPPVPPEGYAPLTLIINLKKLKCSPGEKKPPSTRVNNSDEDDSSDYEENQHIIDHQNDPVDLDENDSDDDEYDEDDDDEEDDSQNEESENEEESNEEIDNADSSDDSSDSDDSDEDNDHQSQLDAILNGLLIQQNLIEKEIMDMSCKLKRKSSSRDAKKPKKTKQTPLDSSNEMTLINPLVDAHHPLVGAAQMSTPIYQLRQGHLPLMPSGSENNSMFAFGKEQEIISPLQPQPQSQPEPEVVSRRDRRSHDRSKDKEKEKERDLLRSDHLKKDPPQSSKDNQRKDSQKRESRKKNSHKKDSQQPKKTQPTLAKPETSSSSSSKREHSSRREHSSKRDESSKKAEDSKKKDDLKKTDSRKEDLTKTEPKTSEENKKPDLKQNEETTKTETKRSRDRSRKDSSSKKSSKKDRSSKKEEKRRSGSSMTRQKAKEEEEKLKEEKAKLEKQKQEKAAQEQLRQEKAKQKQLEKERLQQEKLERERLEKEKLEQERLELERVEQERLEKERLEKERLEQERLQNEKMKRERDRLKREKHKKEKLERERLKQEKLELERIKKEKLELERLEKEKQEQQRLELENLQKQKLEQERLERERLQKEKLERERLKKEKHEQEKRERLKQEKLEREKLKQEKLERERIQKEKLERERIQKEKLERERIQKEKLERERIQKEKLERERIQKEKLERERIQKEKLERERIQKEKLEQEKLEKEKQKQEKLEREKLQKEKEKLKQLEREKQKKEKLEREKLKKEKQEQEKLAREKLQQEALERERIEQEKIQEKLQEEMRLEQERRLENDRIFEQLKNSAPLEAAAPALEVDESKGKDIDKEKEKEKDKDKEKSKKRKKPSRHERSKHKKQAVDEKEKEKQSENDNEKNKEKDKTKEKEKEQEKEKHIESVKAKIVETQVYLEEKSVPNPPLQVSVPAKSSDSLKTSALPNEASGKLPSEEKHKHQHLERPQATVSPQKHSQNLPQGTNVESQPPKPSTSGKGLQKSEKRKRPDVSSEREQKQESKKQLLEAQAQRQQAKHPQQMSHPTNQLQGQQHSETQSQDPNQEAATQRKERSLLPPPPPQASRKPDEGDKSKSSGSDLYKINIYQQKLSFENKLKLYNKQQDQASSNSSASPTPSTPTSTSSSASGSGSGTGLGSSSSSSHSHSSRRSHSSSSSHSHAHSSHSGYHPYSSKSNKTHSQTTPGKNPHMQQSSTKASPNTKLSPPPQQQQQGGFSNLPPQHSPSSVSPLISGHSHAQYDHHRERYGSYNYHRTAQQQVHQTMDHMQQDDPQRFMMMPSQSSGYSNQATRPHHFMHNMPHPDQDLQINHMRKQHQRQHHSMHNHQQSLRNNQQQQQNHYHHQGQHQYQHQYHHQNQHYQNNSYNKISPSHVELLLNLVENL